jgi:hypothetical protein
MEESMHGSPEKPGKAEHNIYGSWGVRLLAIPVLLLTALIGFVVSHPGASNWIQAEFGGTGRVPDTTPTAKPAMEFRTVKDH